MNEHEPAYPNPHNTVLSIKDNKGNWIHSRNPNGLTKRELFAAMALQGILSNAAMNGDPADQIAIDAVAAADALLAELAKEKT